MKFTVYTGLLIEKSEGVYLQIDNWDDWFKYSTMYYLRYVNSEGKIYDIGSVKIGQYNMEQRRPGIPDSFEILGEEFFSVGQSDEYYENLKKLDDKIRENILISLRDMAYDLDIFEKFKNEDVVNVSLMRDVTKKTITKQFHRMAHGGARLTRFTFGYRFPSIINYRNNMFDVDKPAAITFKVEPESNPPTNIHIVIGRNGVGKTFMIKNIISAITDNKSDEEAGYFFELQHENKISADELFANAICVGFSAFDDLSSSIDTKNNDSLPLIFIGLDNKYDGENVFYNDNSRIDKLSFQFANSLFKSFLSKSKITLWRRAMSVLNYDNYFQESGISELKFVKDENIFIQTARERFALLSSGHKIILLTITRLVEFIEEKSLIILDEPETHLHPPLLAAFIRALSDILIEKNGVAFITTHSPIVLQEVPSSCAWKMQRSRSTVSLEKLDQETFGTNINSLIREIFGLEVDKSGFHKLLKENLIKMNYVFDDVVNNFNHELGDEARAILRLLIALKMRENND